MITYTEGAHDIRGLFNQRLRWKKGRLETFIRYRKLFFSKDKGHSRFLSWFVLPYALYGEIQMLFEPMFVALVASYTIITGDYLSAGLSAIFIFFTFIAAYLFGDREESPLYILLFPAMWILFYVLVFVEYFALLKSIGLLRAGKDIVWQNWSREGVAVNI